ncbi:MAG: ABC-2 transporter permease [Oscillibacter sp.]|nr:ABC-2 transporter permease [Oscillibacter sp.]
MKALIRKDFYLLKKQLWLYALVIVAFQCLPSGAGDLIAVLYAALLPSSAFAYDDLCKWDMMELMLPYSTREIVLSRYCVGWLGTLFLTAVWALSRRLMSWLPFTRNAADVPTLFAGLSLTLCFLALSMPVYFRFSAEKSRLIRTLVLIIVSAAIAGGIAATGAGTAIGAGRQGLSWGLVGTFYLFAAALTAVSIPLSILAWKRRHR